jgi:hypothetical protein
MTISATWKEYNDITMQLSDELGRSKNIVGEYAEYLIKEYLNGTLLGLSNKSADIEKDGVLYQVKARRIEDGTTTQLGVIRSWDFDHLAVVIFDNYGIVKRAHIIPAAIAKEISVENSHQNGYVITTNRNFFSCRKYKDITKQIKELNGEDVSSICEVLTIKTRTFNKLHKIQRWADHPENYNHRIIKAFLTLQKKQDVTKDDLLGLCSQNAKKPAFYVEKFRQNFNSMKTDAGNSHGKVFLEDNGFVYVYPQAMSEIEKYF